MSTVIAPAPRVRAGANRAAAPAVRPSVRPSPRPVPRPARPEPRVEPRRHLRVVRPEERTSRRLTPAGGVVLTVLLFAVLAGLAAAHSLIAQGQIRLDRLDDQLRVEQARYQELRRDLAVMESPERIVAAAAAQGMVTPQDLVYLQPSDTQAEADGADEDGTASTGSAGDDVDPTSGSWPTVKPMLEAPTP